MAVVLVVVDDVPGGGPSAQTRSWAGARSWAVLVDYGTGDPANKAEAMEAARLRKR